VGPQARPHIGVHERFKSPSCVFLCGSSAGSLALPRLQSGDLVDARETARPWAFSDLRAATVRESETAIRPLPFCQSDTGRGEAPAEPHRRADACLRAVLGLESPSYGRGGNWVEKKAGKVQRRRGQEGIGAKERRVFRAVLGLESPSYGWAGIGVVFLPEGRIRLFPALFFQIVIQKPWARWLKFHRHAFFP
jgi:hypothetical protein